MKAKINTLIPPCRTAINNHLKNENGEIPKEFKGYIASMGASIIQAGLLATLAFYQNDSGKKAKSSHLLKAIYDVLKPGHRDDTDGPTLIDYVIRQTLIRENEEEASLDILDKEKLLRYQQEIEDILVAMKLALRTFKIDE